MNTQYLIDSGRPERLLAYFPGVQSLILHFTIILITVILQHPLGFHIAELPFHGIFLAEKFPLQLRF